MNGPEPEPVRPVAIRAAAVLTIFGLYAGVVALAPVETAPAPETLDVSLGTPPPGPGAWRTAGCHSCHSLYGLGGHTGPDLTNVVSRTSTGFVRAAVRAGMPGMPAYTSIEPTQLDAIVRYLIAVDRAADYPPRELNSGVFGDR